MKRKHGFNAQESKLLQSLNTPKKIQDYVSSIFFHGGCNYNVYFSPRQVMAAREADCADAAIFAAATLRFHEKSL